MKSYSALDGGEWLASRSGRFSPEKEPPVHHWLGGWVGPRAGLDSVARRKIPDPTGPAPSVVTALTELSRLVLSDALWKTVYKQNRILE